MSPIFKIISFTKHLWKWYVAMGFFVIAVSLLSLVTPLLTKQVVDLIVLKIKGSSEPFSIFFILLGFIILTDVAVTVLTAVGQYVGDLLAVRLQTHLSKEFYKHLLSLDINFYDNEITGRITNKMYRGIASITDFIQSMLNNFLPFLLTAIVTILLLARYSFVIAVLLAVLFPIYIIISHNSSNRWRVFEDEKNDINDASQGRAFEAISGIRVVKSFASEAHELLTYITSRNKIEKLTVKQSKGWHIYDFYRRVALNLILFAIFSYVVYWTFMGKYTIGEMTLLLTLVQQARFPLFAMSFILGQIQQASSGSKEFFALLDTPSNISDKPKAKAIVATKETREPLIEFHDVSFHYDADKKVLKNITFAIFPGKQLALVGESGQGKSTIVNLLLRYYEPQKGSIVVFGQPISEVTQNSLREQIAVVFQESLLFSGTIMENIRYGKPKSSDEEVIKAAKAANAHEFISEFKDGYNSIVGERGVKLSGGQKQRIAIARAMLKDAPIIILDEATSSLDSKSEVLVQQGLDRLLKNRTSIIIAHRLSTIASADNVLVISGGTIAQYGTAKELLTDKKGPYAQMIALQQSLLTASPEERAQKLKEFDLVG
jgi:ATP-binding cassette, subfamily B, bacterial